MRAAVGDSGCTGADLRSELPFLPAGVGLDGAMGIFLGIDLGSVSVKVAAVGPLEELEALHLEGDFFLATPRSGLPPVLLSPYRRVQGDPVQAASGMLKAFPMAPTQAAILGVRATGSGGKHLAGHLGIDFADEFRAIPRAAEVLHPEIRTIFEMGGETSKFISLEWDGPAASLRIKDYETNGDCAAGTGAFMDQQAARLRLRIEEVGEAALRASTAARIAGRCSVFAKTDMIHAQQRGYGPPEVLRGLCEAVARNFKGSITKGKEVTPPVAFIGGVAMNRGVAQALRELYGLSEGNLLVPPEYAWFGAIGAALLAKEHKGSARTFRSPVSRPPPPASSLALHPPLSLENVLFLRNRVQPYGLPREGEIIDTYLGIDVGSVSTNFALLDNEGNLVKEIYVRTEGRPIEVVRAGLREIQEQVGSRIRVRGVGTTGSGRELIGELVGADAVSDEITAHTTGAMYLSRRFTREPIDTIFEIGGQDAKFIRIEDGIVVDFAMNEACAAGTGSFLEEQAERLGVDISGEFSHLAFLSPHPIRLGERCTVFMERDVYACQQRGAAREDLVAGLAYSVALNYLNRVVRGRKIGEVISFQGGVAYNDAVAAAFVGLLGKPIIVPPHNGVVGAIGTALLAREKVRETRWESTFRGFDVDRVQYRVRDFVCKACPNYCDMQEFTVGGVRTYWGDKCSWKFRRRAKTERMAVIPDLVTLRDRLCWGEPVCGGKPRIGVPRAMSFFDYFPFWCALFRGLGGEVVLSDPTHRSIVYDGVDLTVAEPCFPVKVAHGHVKNLIRKGVDYIFLPNIIDVEGAKPRGRSAVALCPWNQTLPYVVRSVLPLKGWRDRFLAPSVHLGMGREVVEEELAPLFRALGSSRRRGRQALDMAYSTQEEFDRSIREAGREALATLEEKGEAGIILTGRTYNLYDKGLNLDVPGKLRDFYGVNLIPMDFLPLDAEEVSAVNENMYWYSGRRILGAGTFVRRHPHLHLIHLTNFKCGPDSFIKNFMGEASGKPFLVLQLDAHGNDAGVLTRCEAYLDSKGLLRWWATS